jgi:hypothetical protein
MRIQNLPRPLRNFLYKYVVFRPGIVYAYSCLGHYSELREMWAYVGQTRQELIDRHNQHMGAAGYRNKKAALPQSWSDLYPEIRIVWSGKCPDFVLDGIEKFYIKRRKPLYNYIHNTKNPRRIPKYQAAIQRQERDRVRSLRRPAQL